MYLLRISTARSVPPGEELNERKDAATYHESSLSHHSAIVIRTSRDLDVGSALFRLRDFELVNRLNDPYRVSTILGLLSLLLTG